ncbi:MULTISPECIES: acyl-CoA dehydrogenase family protein [unclassified Rhodococcus (in: high G+C Gram-positive bacteria)]|uniref:acyl-CoA dehydrogenase family protein n=1 Tax=unclassified Rhodococcus (in: high G+C Gram-positive bacteria) TaxID=192944 RepID=UPI00146C2932|nr:MULTISPECIES: acyl-CoA dehydrogenase family protein [unclassified Rhodococcus (in: high G+C Gram-positive bacteria)]MBF0662134.1 acyl-CoA dehydrogenase family protein [Rhodococcus sp. (in: high G+C Gram-positive bacteria)]NMD94749.1 acyl-CoA dehydrogenase [Rhodococcus sp. BL-253-APC-6A1W]
MTVESSATDRDVESLDDFRARARTWISANLQRSDFASHIGVLREESSDEEELAAVQRERDLQRALFDAGLAGICVPREYGGQGLTRPYQQVLNEELRGYEYPSRLQVPTFVPCTAVLLEFGTEEQKRRHIPAILKGEELWMQMLSEPSGGSDVAGAVTTAVRDGEDWILNGSKIWTTGAWWSDWALCLVRTNWDVPKNRGLTVFMLPLKQPSIEVHRIEMLSGSSEFCQEYLTDVRVPDSDRIGEVDDGWTVGTRWMFHERMYQNSPYTTIPAGSVRGGSRISELFAVARDAGRLDDPVARDLLGEARALELAKQALNKRVGQGMAARTISDQSASISRLMSGVVESRLVTIGYEFTGADGAAWDEDDGAVAERGVDYLLRQVWCIAGGTTEMARNAISERVLGMPRERSHDPNLAFRDVPKGRAAG